MCQLPAVWGDGWMLLISEITSWKASPGNYCTFILKDKRNRVNEPDMQADEKGRGSRALKHD